MDTDEKIRMITDSTERRIGDLYRQNREDFAELRGLVKDTNARIVDTQLEVAQINVRIDSLSTKTQLVETIGQLHEWCLEEMRRCAAQHKSKPPKRDSLLPNNNNHIYKLLGKIAAGLIGLTAAVYALIQIIGN